MVADMVLDIRPNLVALVAPAAVGLRLPAVTATPQQWRPVCSKPRLLRALDIPRWPWILCRPSFDSPQFNIDRLISHRPRIRFVSRVTGADGCGCVPSALRQAVPDDECNGETVVQSKCCANRHPSSPRRSSRRLTPLRVAWRFFSYALPEPCRAQRPWSPEQKVQAEIAILGQNGWASITPNCCRFT